MCTWAQKKHTLHVASFSSDFFFFFPGRAPSENGVAAVVCAHVVVNTNPSPPHALFNFFFPITTRSGKQEDVLEAEAVAATGTGRKSVSTDARAATIAPASAMGSQMGSNSHSRAGSYLGSRVEERRASAMYGPGGTGSLLDSEVDNNVSVFYAEGSKQGAHSGNGYSGGAAAAAASDSGSWLAATRANDAGEDDEKRLSNANINKLLGE